MTTGEKRPKRVNMTDLAMLLELCHIPRTRNNWRIVSGDKQVGDCKRLILAGMAEEGPSLFGHRSFAATNFGRNVAAAMLGAAHKVVFGQEQEYRA